MTTQKGSPHKGVKSILIVDDDPDMCETLADILEDKGFTVSIAQDGQTAVEAMRRGRYDLIMIDIMMPGMNGVETLNQIKSVDNHVMTLIMTGHSKLEGFVSEALWAGVDGVLYKPFDVDSVIDMIARKGNSRVDLPTIDIKGYEVSANAIEMVPEELARKHSLLPLRVEDGYLVVAMADPTNLYAIEDLRVRTSLNVRPLKASKEEIERAITRYYQGESEIDRQIERITPLSAQVDSDTALRLSADLVAQTPIARAVQLMVRQAVRDQASDIHIEPQESSLRVRYRIDGVLHDTMDLPLRVHAPLVSRIKVLSNLNIAERRRPQDGQFSVDVSGTPVDIRVATINTVHGEMAVLRVLDKSVSVRQLDELGFLPDMEAIYDRVLHAPWGIVLAAGPTGSGKTSTLYASLNQLDRNENKIITIEDPVEYRFQGISQVQVNRQAGITFASGLRAAMRLDPNIILVGEIRDQETASTAVQASLTGHLVFSSIHANDSVGTILRLVDLGVEPFLVTSSLLAVLSQRLVRRVCNHCREEREIPAAERQVYEREVGETRTLFAFGAGCDHCAGTGYRGRVAVMELLVLNDEVRRLVLRNANSDDVQAAALQAGMRSMLQDGMFKAKAGVTTPTEVLKNVFALH
jgi:general secretion pathway protein E